MEYRKLGNSGLTVSEISLGNWITHGAQVHDGIAEACVSAALDAGITTFDTADVYSNTKAETVLGQALKDIRRESIELCTKVCHPTAQVIMTADFHVNTSWKHAMVHYSGYRLIISMSIMLTVMITARRWKRRFWHSPTWCVRARFTTSG